MLEETGRVSPLFFSYSIEQLARPRSYRVLFSSPVDKSDIAVTIETSRLFAPSCSGDDEVGTWQNETTVDRNVGEDVFSNLGHYERSCRTLRVGIFYRARTSVDANRIDPMADTTLDRVVPEHRRNTRHSARYFIFCEATSRRNFSIPMAA